MRIERVHVIDSHTGGEPTRVVVAGAPNLGGGSVAEQLQVFRRDQDRFRSAVVNEPRGSDVVVGALLCPPSEPSCVAGVIFFNNVGMLHMCGHGTIGVIATLAHLGRIHPGEHRLETPVGIIRTILHEDGTVSLDNVASYRKAHNVVLEIPDFGRFCGDVAWGGNWFFLVQYQHCPITLVHIDELMTVTRKIRHAINSQGYPEVDHIELVGPPASTGANARNFVLCPGHAYDRSPCGTGTSAKLACLAADGKLAEGESWVQESVIGSRFTGSYRWRDRSAGVIVPTITGRAYVNAEAHLLLNPDDPFCWGIGDGSTSDGLVRVG